MSGSEANGGTDGVAPIDVDPETVTIRRARSTEARELAQFHIDAHPNAFLPRLGLRFMTRLYRAFVDYPQGVAYVAEHDGQIIGYSTGVLSMSRFYKDFVKRHAIPAVLSAMPTILRPSVVKRMWQTFRYPDAVPETLPEAEYTTLAVKPWIRSRGLGGRLSDAVLDGLADLGVTEIRGTVHHTNDPMNRMMQRVGFRQVGEMTLHEGHSFLYVITVGPGGARPDAATPDLDPPGASA
jgi:ribosomal protein S18 acetylase RimI-like enzyme